VSAEDENAIVEKMVVDLKGNVFDLVGGSLPRYQRLSETAISQRLQLQEKAVKTESLNDVFKSAVTEIRKAGSMLRNHISQQLLGSSEDTNVFKRLDSVKDGLQKVIANSSAEV
jgi:hypothetical protein